MSAISTIVSDLKQNFHKNNLDEMLEIVYVTDADLMPENPDQLNGWFVVGTDLHGIIAYFFYYKEALSYRLDIINRYLNS